MIFGCNISTFRFCGADCTDESSPATRCEAVIDKKLDCGHTAKNVKCFEKHRSQVCREPCGMELQCEHRCGGTCSECDGARLHKPCGEKCGRRLQCGHVCRERCGLPCLCSRHCQTACGHSHCRLSCAEPCVPCKEPCLRGTLPACPHLRCLKLCSEPCEDQLCTEPCPLPLQCGHPCVGVCGETCPDLCRICHKERFDDLIEDSLFPCDPDDR